jgi:hypothetical protein
LESEANKLGWKIEDFSSPSLSCRTIVYKGMFVALQFANFYSAMAYPGSKLYREANDKGWKLPATWAGYSQHNKFCRPLDTEHVSAADVLAFRDYAFTSYFTNPDYLEMVIRKFGSLTYEHVKSMTSYNLERWLINPPMEPYPALEKVGGYT